MPTEIIEFHGAAPFSEISRQNAATTSCPFVKAKCKKTVSGGACSLGRLNGPPVIICPNRLYTDNFKILQRIADECFGTGSALLTADTAEMQLHNGALPDVPVVVYGSYFSGEIGIKAPSSDEDTEGSYKIDFLLTHVDLNLRPVSFVAVEVQTIDTTNSYKEVSNRLYASYEASPVGTPNDFLLDTDAGFNWENVSKRILPQLIYKGLALRRDAKAHHGMYFVVPDVVLDKILRRVGGDLLDYPKGPGTVTFHSYSLGEPMMNGLRDLVQAKSITTSVEQLSYAFVSPRNLPAGGIYETALTQKLDKVIQKAARKRKLAQQAKK